MAAPRLLLKTDLAGLQPLLLRGQPVQALHQRLTDQLTARGAPAALFAEPITGAGAISWYGEAAGEPQPLPTLSNARRAEAEAALTRQLQALEPLLDDAEIGPLLRRALVLPSADSIRSGSPRRQMGSSQLPPWPRPRRQRLPRLHLLRPARQHRHHPFRRPRPSWPPRRARLLAGRLGWCRCWHSWR
jgi:hypothetical protein